MITGTTYLERGKPVVVLAQWSRSLPDDGFVQWWFREPRSAPRNVLVERAGGARVVRPFRGLRKVKPCA